MLGRDLVWVVRRSQVTLRSWNGLRLSIAAREKTLLLKSSRWPGISVHWWTLYFDRELVVGGWLSVLLFHGVWILAGFVWEGVCWLTIVWVLVR